MKVEVEAPIVRDAPAVNRVAMAVYRSNAKDAVGAVAKATVDEESAREADAERVNANAEALLQTAKESVKNIKEIIIRVNIKVLEMRNKREVAILALKAAHENVGNASKIALSDITNAAGAVLENAILAEKKADANIKTMERIYMEADVEKTIAERVEWDINNAITNLASGIGGAEVPLLVKATVDVMTEGEIAMTSVRAKIVTMLAEMDAINASVNKYQKYKQKYLALKTELNM